nr:hypothetical protein BaRGS_029281 [Batillaria attramentaria]
MRQDSELFEGPSQPTGSFANPFLTTDHEKVPEIDIDDYPSDHECRIKSAVERLNTRAVIGDGTVLAQLLNGEFSEAVDHYVIIDCRYPYEYNGGHIKGATNMYCGDSVDEIMGWRMKKDDTDRRVVLIFHCEFSSQRAPTMG